MPCAIRVVRVAVIVWCGCGIGVVWRSCEKTRAMSRQAQKDGQTNCLEAIRVIPLVPVDGIRYDEGRDFFLTRNTKVFKGNKS